MHVPDGMISELPRSLNASARQHRLLLCECNFTILGAERRLLWVQAELYLAAGCCP